MRIRTVKLLMIVAGILVLLLITAELLVTHAIRKQLISSFNGSCATCTLTLDRVHLSWLPFSIILEGVHLSGGDPKTTKVEAEIERVVARSSFRNLILKKLHFSRIQFHTPHVVVTEGDLRVPASHREKRTLRSLVIESIDLIAGKFTYRRVFGDDKEERTATLHVKEIQGNIGKLSTLRPSRDHMSRGQAKGRLENSGGFILTVEAAPFSEILKVNVDLNMAGQNLADVSLFFQTTDGVKLAGKLEKGQSLIKVREKRLTGWVRAEYDGLDFKFEETESRGKISTFFSNLINSMKLRRSDTGKKPTDQTHETELIREPNETLIHFILRGMKEAAIEVAKGG